LVRRYVREWLCYSLAELPGGAAAFEVERQVKRRGFQGKPPLLNP
jgi:hypothetical protein